MDSCENVMRTSDLKISHYNVSTKNNIIYFNLSLKQFKSTFI